MNLFLIFCIIWKNIPSSPFVLFCIFIWSLCFPDLQQWSLKPQSRVERTGSYWLLKRRDHLSLSDPRHHSAFGILELGLMTFLDIHAKHKLVNILEASNEIEWCLFQGNMQFESDGESVNIVGQEVVNHISELTATDPESVNKSLLYRTVATGGGEVIEKGHTEQDACFGRDAFAKVPETGPK